MMKGMAKIVLWSIAGLFVVVLSVQLYHLYRRGTVFEQRATALHERVDALRLENEQLEQDIDYLSYLPNLVKEFKALFHYKKPGEQLFIIIPQNSP